MRLVVDTNVLVREVDSLRDRVNAISGDAHTVQGKRVN